MVHATRSCNNATKGKGVGAKRCKACTKHEYITDTYENFIRIRYT